MWLDSGKKIQAQLKKKKLFSRPEYVIFTSNLYEKKKKNFILKDAVCPNVEYECSWLALWWQSRSNGMGTS